MQEHSTLAFILSTEQTGERDGRVTMYTEALGKITARAKSLYAPKSKLAGHLQPLNLAQVRLVEKKGVQVVDALTLRRYAQDVDTSRVIELLAVARLIDGLTSSQQPDQELWGLIASGNIVSRSLLKVLGFDPAHAECSRCKKNQPKHFLLRDGSYLCDSCLRVVRERAAIVL